MAVQAPDVLVLPVVVPAPLHAMVPLQLLDAPGVLQAVLPVVRDHVDRDVQVGAREHAKAVAVLDVLAHVVADVHQTVLQDALVHQNLLAVHRAQTHVAVVVPQIALKTAAITVKRDVVPAVIMAAMIAVRGHVARLALGLVQDAA